MNQSTCTKCKRFILRKCPCAFYGADNDLRLADDCNPIVATGNGPSLPLLRPAAASLVGCVSPSFLSSLPDENDRMRCHSSQMSSDISSALSTVKSSLSILTKSISSSKHRIARIESGLSLLDRLEPILETFNARMVEFDGVLQRLGDVEDATNRLAAATDGLFTDLVAMSARQIILEERFARLEREVRAGPATSAGSSHALTDVC